MQENHSDENLLNSFVESGDEQAFRRLAERYSGLIFHAALRILNERTLAEDVAQRVLGVLAKKAAHVSRGSAPLPAWLHRTTILEARSARRIESRHHRKKAALMNTPTDPSHPIDPAWHEALPHLDVAIDKLPESDRHVLLLHFVNEMTFPEIARRVGRSAAAVQKQSRRALESLHRSLVSRGAKISLGLLTAGLTAEMAKAGPVIALPVFASASSLGAVSTSTVIVKKSTIIAISTTFLICGIPLAKQQASIRGLEAKLLNPADSVMSVGTSSRRTSSRTTSSGNRSIPERLAGDLRAKDRDVPRYRGAVEYLGELSHEALISLIKETADSSLNVNAQIIVIGKALWTLADWNLETGRPRTPEAALNALMDHLPIETIAAIQQSQNLLAYYMRSFSEKDGSGALAWFQEHFDQISAVGEIRRGSAEQFENEIRIALSYGLIFSSPTDAVAILQKLPPRTIIDEFGQIVRSVEPSLIKDASGFIQVARELLPEKDASEVIGKLSRIHYEYRIGRFGNADMLLGNYEFSPSESEAILKQAGAYFLVAASQSSGGLEETIPEYLEWLSTHSQDEADRRVGETLGKMTLSWGNTKEPIYKAMLNYQSLGLNDDTLISFLKTAGSRFEMEEVKTLAGMLSDQGKAAGFVDEIKLPASQ